MTELSIIYFQECNEVRKIKGVIETDEGDFVVLNTLKRKFTINKKYIIKIENILPETVKLNGDGK